MHEHYPHQVLKTATRATLETDEGTLSGRCIAVASLRRHRIISAPTPAWLVYAEPLSIDLHALQAVVRSASSAMDLCRAVQARCRMPVIDRRVTLALRLIDEMLDDQVSARVVAARAAISLSQLQRVLSARMGLSVRRLVRWRRMRLAVELISSGQTVTQAAHAAGFADAAHLSRTVRMMFAVAPASGLLGTRRVGD